MSEATKFTPVRGTESTILAMARQDGRLYFTTDTKKIFMDTNENNKMLMGGAGNSSIYYGEKELSDDEEELDSITFESDEIEGTDSPIVDNLILNVPNGCFYRVTAVNNTTHAITATKLTVAGSGSGGGNNRFISQLRCDVAMPTNTNFLYGQSNTLTITPYSAYADVNTPVDSYVNVSWRIEAQDDSSLYLEGNLTTVNGSENIPNGTTIQFEFGSKLFADKMNIIKFYVSGYSSGTMTTPQVVQANCVKLELKESSEFNALKMYEGSATITCEVYGSINKILEFWVDDALIESKTLSSSGPGVGRQSTVVSNLTHGTHTVEIKLYQSDTAGNKGYQVPSLKYEIASKESGNNTPIIWVGSYKEQYNNYEQIVIPYMAFNPTTGDTCQVRFYKGENELAISPASVTFYSTTSNYEQLEITDAACPSITGEKLYNTYYIVCGNVSRAINFYVYQTGTMVLAAQDNLLVKFDAAGRSNNESSLTRDKWSYTGKNNKNYVGVFDGFNWYNNGWIKDNDGNSCLRISNGSSFKIPLGATVFNSTIQGQQSHTFEFEFKVKNIQNYEKLIKLVTRYSYPNDGKGHQFDNDNAWYAEYVNNQQGNYDSYDQYLAAWLPTQGMSYDNLEYVRVDSITSTDTAFCNYYDSTKNVGFCIGTQDAFFKTNQATLNANFVEDKIVNLAFVYSQSESLVSIFLNGVLSGAVHVGDNDGSFTIGNANSYIVFNSNYCDIDLYKFRAYNTSFSISEILNNYSIDLRDTEMYDQSTSLTTTNSTNGEQELSYNFMLNYNNEHPDDHLMPYMIFSDVQGDALPYSKLDEKEVTWSFVNTGLDHMYDNGDLARAALAANYPTATYPIYWIKAADLNDALTSTPKTANYKIQMVKLKSGTTDEWENDGDKVSLNMSKVDLTKAKTKSTDGYCCIYRTLTQVENYYLHHGASFTASGISLKTQGTSSQFYPRRNYKAKCGTSMVANRGPFKDNVFPMAFFYMDNDSVGTSKFTLKIDYMESSGSYNTGFANLINNAYTKHPIDDYPFANKVITKDLRTSVQGFPTMAFHKKANGDYTFIGRYNFNVDKNSDECYGYKLFENNDLISGEKVKTPYVLKNGKAASVADVAECWEFSDNNRGYCSFRDPLNRAILSFDYPAVSGNTTDAEAGYHTNANGSCPVVADSFEYRFHKKKDVLDYLYNPSDPSLDMEDVLDAAGEDEATVSDLEWRREFLLGSPMKEDGTRETPGAMSNWEKAVQWVWSTCTDVVGDEDKVFEVYATKQTNLTSFYKTFSKLIYNVSTNNFSSVDVLVFDVELNNGNVVKQSTTYENALASLSNVTGLTQENILSATGIIAKNYGVRDEENSTDTVEVKKVNADSIFQAYADVNGYEYFDYTLDPDSGDEIGNFRKGIVQLRSEAMTIIQQNPSDYTFEPAANSNELPVRALSTAYNTGKNIYYFDTKQYRLAKFKNEFSKHFDKEYTLVYFVMTEVFMCYDSRGKNAMFASWGPKEQGGEYIWYPVFYDIDTQLGINNTGIPSFEYYVNATEDGCFSTNDSVLWGNIYRCFLDDIKGKYQELRTTIKRGNSSINIAPLATSIDYFGQAAVEHIENWYNCDADACNSICMKGKRPLVAINLDEYYKYISIMNTRGSGYQGTDGNPKYDSSGAFLYALQGNRSLSRQQFLSRRINFIDSWLTRGNYAEGTGATIKFRTSANDPDNTSDIWIDNTSTINSSGQEIEGLTANAGYYTDPITYDIYGDPIKLHPLDADFFVKLSPYQRSYVTLATDNAPLPSVEYEGSPVRLEFPANVVTGVRKSPQYAEQLLYLYGADYMKDIGDVSLLYPREFELKGATHLQRIILGNDSENYFNKKLKSPQFDADSASYKAGTGGKPLLKEVVFTNVQVDGNVNVALDFSSSEKMQIFRALGMNLSGVKFADGVALHTLHLPATITELSLKEARALKGLITNYVTPTKDTAGNWQAQKGLYIKGLTDITKSQAASTGETNITKLTIAGGNMGYDSYDLLNTLFLIKENKNGNLAISLTDINWTPFTQMVKGTVYNESELNNYYIDNEHYQLIPYSEYQVNALNQYAYNTDDWKEQLKSGRLYYKNTEISNDTINQISDEFLYKVNGSTNPYVNGMMPTLAISTHYTNTDETNNAIPRISGNVYVNNTNVDIDESWIRNTLIGSYYPDLKIFVNKVKKAYGAKFVTVDDDGSLNTVETYKVSQADYEGGQTWFPTNPYTVTKLSTDMNKQGWDFFGWSTVKGSKENVISSADWVSQTFDENTYEYTFYAIYEKHKYNINFYNEDNTLLETIQTQFGDTLTTPINIPYKDDSSLELTQCYAFLGYSRTNGGELVDLSTITATEDMMFFAKFAQKSVYDNINTDYFTVANTNFTYTDSVSGGSYGDISENGYVLSLNSKVKGKITIPAEFTFNGVKKRVVAINKTFNGNNNGINLTHVFFGKDADNKTAIRQLYYQSSTGESDGGVFYNCNNLIYFEFVDSLRKIDNYSFFRCNKLTNNTFGNNVFYIGDGAFNSAFASSVTEIFINSSVVKFGEYAFAYNRGNFTNYGNCVYSTCTIGSATEKSKINPIACKKPIFTQDDAAQISVIVYSNADSASLISKITNGASNITVTVS